jgi:hypothetical protein
VHPTAEWIANQFTEACRWEQLPRYLIRDRDAAYGGVFIRRVRSMGIRDQPTSPRSPWQSRYVERLIGSIRRKCLDHVVVRGECHLRHRSKSHPVSALPRPCAWPWSATRTLVSRGLHPEQLLGKVERRGGVPANSLILPSLRDLPFGTAAGPLLAPMSDLATPQSAEGLGLADKIQRPSHTLVASLHSDERGQELHLRV